MAVSKENLQTLDKGFKALGMMMDEFFMSQLKIACELLLKEVYRVYHKGAGWHGFTGQTQTSYMAAYFYKGNMGIVEQTEWKKSPVYRKLRLGETKNLKNPYDGKPRARTGKVDTNGLSGAETSYQFLESYRPSPKCWSIVLTTGTEYSVFLEEQYGLDVLTGAYSVAPKVLKRLFSMSQNGALQAIISQL